MAYSILRHEHLTTVSLSDEITGNDLIDAYLDLTNDPQHGPHLNVVWDCRHISSIVVDWPQLISLRALIMDRCSDQAGPGRFAIIASRDVVYLTGVMVCRLTRKKPKPKKVFRSLDDASTWLNISNLSRYL